MPTDSAPTKPSPLTCVDHCECATGPKALYREYNGEEEYFTGIVVHDDMTCIKLHFPGQGDVNGAGHEMGDLEFETDFCHYPNSTFKPTIKKLDSHLLNFSVGTGQLDKILATDGNNAEYDVEYPFFIPRNGWTTPQIRAGDSVKIVAMGGIHGIPFIMERFWCDVASVTNTGIVSGICQANLNGLHHIKNGDLISFRVTSVMGMKKGKHWN